ncbi:MAG: hypothetical protein WDZ69_02880 [Candidatus Pacearchaeota archaeon]
MRKITIVIQAIPFCFGPGAQALAIGNELRSILGKRLNLVVLGTETTYEFLQKSKTFDRIYKYSSERKKIPKKIRKILLSADKIICIGDFDFIDVANTFRRKVEFVDPLFWMWNKFPSNINLCNKYYAVDFPGVKKKVKEYTKKYPGSLKPMIVNQICEYQKRKKNRETIIMQFGGIQNPFGVNINLVVAMVEELSNSIKNSPNIRKVLVRGGSKVMETVKNNVKDLDKRIKIGAVHHNEFLRELSSCKALLTVPGMSIVYEAFAGKIPLIFILPLNYSQHRQPLAYQKIFKNFEFISFNDFKGYKTLPEDAPEDEAIKKAIIMGDKFFNDPIARKKFKGRITKFLSKKRHKIMVTRKKKIKIDGAMQIARDITKQILQK